MTTSAEQKTAGTNTPQDKMWAGKYKTPEDLENAYLGQNKEVYKLLDEKKSLAEQVSKVATVPDAYSVPEGLEHIKSEIDDMKIIAKNSGLSQTHFEKMLSELNTKRSVEFEKREAAKKEIGAENITVLTDYVKKNYPEALHDTVLTKIIENPDVRKQAMSDRDKRLDSSTPGMGGSNPGAGGGSEPYDGHAEMLKLGREVEMNPHDSRSREKLIKLAREVGHARQEKN